ncbi:RNA-directed DNA polymerase, eukaryota, partial [Tanacetum coccineum]
METISAVDVKILWGNYYFEYLISGALGNSGGILCVWDPNSFHKDQHIISDNFVALYGTWKPTKTKMLLISVYAPQAITDKRVLWSYISSLIARWDGDCIVMEDFNEVRYVEERLGSVFHAQEASEFNYFIYNSGLVDVHLEGYSFTWSHPSASKMSKLDRFLVTEGLVSLFPHISAICLDRHLSDHHPILLRDAISDYGATPFLFYHSWLQLDGKRANLSIKGIMVDGEWVDDPIRVKEEFHLESPVTSDEIRNAVWGCGEDKSPGPDGFTFDFFRKFWSIIGPDFYLAVEWFFQHHSFSKGCNSSFVALIQKTNDPRFVSDYRPISLIGSLYKVVTKVLATRLSLVISDLVSDVQTAFLPNRQILDGPFIINELLSWCNHNKQHAMLFKVDFAKAYDSVRWNYLDDVLRSFGFGSKWRSWISGSLISGVGVPREIVNTAATNLGCSVMTTPFKYLGVMVRGNMALVKAWDEVIVPKFVLHSMEVIRMKFFYGIHGEDKKITWVSWSKVLAAKEYGGLGVSSYYALNRALLFKWVWRFTSQDNSLWFRVISCIHGVDLLSHCRIRVGNGYRTRFWKDKWIGDNHLCHLFPRVYALETTKDCSVAEKLNGSVLDSFRRNARGGVEEHQLAQLRLLIDPVILSSSEDRWVWELNSDGGFHVKDIRRLLDEFFLPKVDVATRWIKYVPIKINVFAWRVWLDRLPTRTNLLQRNVSVPSLLCPICSSSSEDISHLFFKCTLAVDVSRLICRWWDLAWSPLVSYSEWLDWFKSIRLNSKSKGVLEGVFYVSWWSIWNYRNHLLFADQPPRKDVNKVQVKDTLDGRLLKSYYYKDLLVNVGELPEIDPYEEVAQQGQAPPLSPAYVPDPMELDEHVSVYVPELEHPEYHVPIDDDIQVEDQPYADDDSPTAKSPGHIADSESMEKDSIDYPDEPEDGDEDPEEDHTDDPADGEDGDNEPSDDDDDDDTNDEDEEPIEYEEEEEHLALTESSVVPVVDPVPSAEDTEAFETDKSAPTSRSPQTRVLFSQTCLRRERKTVRL